MSFEFRGLEFHSSRMWQWAQVERALDFMQKFDLNALIFHQNDILEHLVFPQEYFSDELMWKRWPVRMHSIYQNRHYINKVVREAKQRGISFYFEVKELSFVEEMLEVVPDLKAPDGSISAHHPFWWHFLDVKLRELIAAVPDFAGIIVSPGTRESKISVSTGPDADAIDTARRWYTELIRAMHVPLAEHSRTLAVRDFSYTAEHQSHIIEAARAVSKDIVISLKNTPHDYYPTFPDNPCIGRTSGLAQWVEYDTWGQFFGLGVFPVSVVEDMQARMRHALANDVRGIFLRTDWEVITDAGVFNSPNILNLIAGAVLSRNVDAPLDNIYEAFAEHGLYSPLRESSRLPALDLPRAPSAGEKLKDFMTASWQVMEKAAFVRGHLFHEDDQYCDTVEKAFAMMVDIHGRDEWEPGASALVEASDENIAVIVAEKEQAVAEVRALPERLRVSELGFSAQTTADFETMLELYELWVRGFLLCARAVFLTRKAQQTGKPEDAATALSTVIPLRAFREEVTKRLVGTQFPHYVYWLLDMNRIASLGNDIEAKLK